MESPPSTSIWSEAFILSDDSGLLLTSGSVSSGSMSGGLGQLPLEYQDSDKSDSLDGMSDIICGEHYNTLKKGPPHWIEPPPQFQDRPNVYDAYAELLAESVIREVLEGSRPNRVNVQAFRPVQQRTYWLPFSPCHGGRPSSRSSLGSSRLSSSHNSLAVTTAHHADDSSFITQAVSHDTLSSVQISDLYNVPFDSDVYALPVDTVRPPTKPRRQPQQQKRRRRNTASGFRELEQHARPKRTLRPVERVEACKRHSVAGTSADAEPVHMTLQEVRTYLQTLYSSSSDSEHKDNIAARTRTAVIISNNNNNKYSSDRSNQPRKKSTFLINIKNKKVKDSCDSLAKQQIEALSPVKQDKRKTTRVFSIKQTLCNMFRFRRILPSEHEKAKKAEAEGARVVSRDDADCNRNITRRALPPLPGQKKPVEDSQK